MLSRVRAAFFNVKPFAAAVGPIIAFSTGLTCLNNHLDQEEERKAKRANPGHIVEKVPVKCYYADYWRYTCSQWRVVNGPEVASQVSNLNSTSQVRHYYITSIDEASKICKLK